MQLIETKTLATAAAAIEFTSIPQDGTDLVVTLSIRSSLALTDDPLLYRINSDTSGYTGRTLHGTGSAGGSIPITTATSAQASGTWGRTSHEGINGATTTANTFSSVSLYIPNYALTQAKSLSMDYVLENNATFADVVIVALAYSGTSPITTLAFALRDGNIVAETTISLYKITKGSDGIVTTS
jgi:hypothetical protein